MTHLFMVPLTHGTMFIREIDRHKRTIEYEVRDKEEGRLLEPVRKSPFIIHEGKIHFDMRFIPLAQVEKIIQYLYEEG